LPIIKILLTKQKRYCPPSSMDDIEGFLKETEFCDFSNTAIQKLAGEIRHNCKNQREVAIFTFYWVRDNILYSVGSWQKKASETLSERKGTCTNKANLLVALLRVNKIPAGYGIMKVYGQRYFGPVGIPMLTKFVGKISTHVYVLVYLNKKWIKCDPSIDRKLGKNIYSFDKTTELVEWDGDRDAMLGLDKNDILKNNFPIMRVEHLMIKKPKNAKGIPLKIANIYINFIRANEQKVSNEKELGALFKKWLKARHSFYFYCFFAASWLKDLGIRLKKDEKNS